MSNGVQDLHMYYVHAAVNEREMARNCAICIINMIAY